MPQVEREVPRTDDLEGIGLLYDALARAGFTADGVRNALATDITSGRDALELPLYLRLLEGSGPLGTQVKLFLLAVEVDAGEAEAAFPGLELERLVEMGVLRREGERVAGATELTPVGDLLIASDPSAQQRTNDDHVLGVSPPTQILERLTIRAPVGSALDIGTGSGQLALLLHRHAGRVVGVDINPRALRFAAFNAALNGMRRLELLQGDLFAPVGEERFDLIVCNPPYVISPETEMVYRDSVLRGDAFSERVVRELPSHLSETGIGQMLISWTHDPGDDWAAPVRRWVDGNGCDALLFRFSESTPLDYAAAWNRPYRSEPHRYADALDRWSRYFAELGIEAISWGALTLRRRNDGRQPWFSAHSATSEQVSNAGDQLLRLFAAQDILVGASDEDLLAAPLRLADHHRLDQTVQLDRGAVYTERAVLRLDDGLAFATPIDPDVAQLVALFDGVRPLSAVVAELASSLEDTSEETLTPLALQVARHLLGVGILIPA
jgi:methylase of polypeptide subunit release factors